MVNRAPTEAARLPQPPQATTRLGYLPDRYAACQLVPPAGLEVSTTRLATPSSSPPRQLLAVLLLALALLVQAGSPLPTLAVVPLLPVVAPIVVSGQAASVRLLPSGFTPTQRPPASPTVDTITLLLTPPPDLILPQRAYASPSALAAKPPTTAPTAPPATTNPLRVAKLPTAPAHPTAARSLAPKATPPPVNPGGNRTADEPPDLIIEQPSPTTQSVPATEPPAVGQPPTEPPPAPVEDERAGAELAIRLLVAQRGDAVHLRDAAAFRATVDPQKPLLLHEQTVWFDDLFTHQPTYFALTLDRLNLGADGSWATATLTERHDLGGAHAVSSQVLFRKLAGQWYYSDLAFQYLATPHFQIAYFAANAAVAKAMVAVAERAYATITGDLDVAPVGVTEVKFYPSAALLQDSVRLSLPTWVGGWSMAGESIKAAYNGAPTQAYLNLMAHEFTHAVQNSMGLTRGNSPDWLNEGLAVYEAERVAPLGSEQASRPTILREALRDDRFFAWAAFPSFQQVAGGQVNLAYEQAYSGVAYLVELYGMDRFNAMLHYLVAGNGVDEAFIQAFGLGLDDFEAGWRVWLAERYK